MEITKAQQLLLNNKFSPDEQQLGRIKNHKVKPLFNTYPVTRIKSSTSEEFSPTVPPEVSTLEGTIVSTHATNFATVPTKNFHTVNYSQCFRIAEIYKKDYLLDLDESDLDNFKDVISRNEFKLNNRYAETIRKMQLGEFVGNTGDLDRVIKTHPFADPKVVVFKESVADFTKNFYKLSGLEILSFFEAVFSKVTEAGYDAYDIDSVAIDDELYRYLGTILVNKNSTVTIRDELFRNYEVHRVYPNKGKGDPSASNYYDQVNKPCYSLKNSILFFNRYSVEMKYENLGASDDRREANLRHDTREVEHVLTANLFPPCVVNYSNIFKLTLATPEE